MARLPVGVVDRSEAGLGDRDPRTGVGVLEHHADLDPFWRIDVSLGPPQAFKCHALVDDPAEAGRSSSRCVVVLATGVRLRQPGRSLPGVREALPRPLLGNRQHERPPVRGARFEIARHVGSSWTQTSSATPLGRGYTAKAILYVSPLRRPYFLASAATAAKQSFKNAWRSPSSPRWTSTSTHR